MDLDALAATASEYKTAICRQDPFLCGPEGVSLIGADMDREGITGAVIAARPQRLMTDAFTFPQDKVLKKGEPS